MLVVVSLGPGAMDERDQSSGTDMVDPISDIRLGSTAVVDPANIMLAGVHNGYHLPLGSGMATTRPTTAGDAGALSRGLHGDRGLLSALGQQHRFDGLPR
jgi:hypothetical protein